MDPWVSVGQSAWRDSVSPILPSVIEVRYASMPSGTGNPDFAPRHLHIHRRVDRTSLRDIYLLAIWVP